MDWGRENGPQVAGPSLEPLRRPLCTTLECEEDPEGRVPWGGERLLSAQGRRERDTAPCADFGVGASVASFTRAAGPRYLLAAGAFSPGSQAQVTFLPRPGSCAAAGDIAVEISLLQLHLERA